MARRPDAFGYFDPPYEFSDERRNCFYGVNGEDHRGFDHDRLFQAVQNRPNWIMSYNADDHVLERYTDFPMAFPHWPYGMGKTSESNEVLIFSPDLADLAAVARERITADQAEYEANLPRPSNDNALSLSTPSWEAPDLSVSVETVTAAPPFPNAILGEDLGGLVRRCRGGRQRPLRLCGGFAADGLGRADRQRRHGSGGRRLRSAFGALDVPRWQIRRGQDPGHDRHQRHR